MTSVSTESLRAMRASLDMLNDAGDIRALATLLDIEIERREAADRAEQRAWLRENTRFETGTGPGSRTVFAMHRPTGIMGVGNSASRALDQVERELHRRGEASAPAPKCGNLPPGEALVGLGVRCTEALGHQGDRHRWTDPTGNAISWGGLTGEIWGD